MKTKCLNIMAAFLSAGYFLATPSEIIRYQICLQTLSCRTCTGEYLELSQDHVKQINQSDYSCLEDRQMYDPRKSKERYILQTRCAIVEDDMLVIPCSKQDSAPLEILPLNPDYLRIKLHDPRLKSDLCCYYQAGFGQKVVESQGLDRGAQRLFPGFWRIDEIAELVPVKPGDMYTDDICIHASLLMEKLSINGTLITVVMHHTLDNVIEEMHLLETFAASTNRSAIDAYMLLSVLATQARQNHISSCISLAQRLSHSF